MKRCLLILLFCVMLAMPSLQAMPDGNVQRTTPTVAVSDANVIGGTGHMTLIAGSDDEIFNIYSITGQLLHVVRVAASGQVSIDVPKGFYIVKCGSRWSRKVVVR